MDILSLRPRDTPEFMNGAWLGCVCWAAGKPELLNAFTEETGCSLPPVRRTAIEAMIDEATGVKEEVLRKFILWVNDNVWGRLD